MPAMKRDLSKVIFVRTSATTYDLIQRYAMEREIPMSTAIITLCRKGIERENSKRRGRE